MIIIAVVVILILGGGGYLGYNNFQQWNKAQEKVAQDRGTKARITSENEELAKELKDSAPSENAPVEVKSDYYSETADLEYRLGRIDSALESFLKLQELKGQENMRSYDLLVGAKIYAKNGNMTKAREMVALAEAAVKRQQPDPINYDLYMDQVDDVRKELLE
jgi:cytochrome c-type biogenesis protein CcmH/NrfG